MSKHRQGWVLGIFGNGYCEQEAKVFQFHLNEEQEIYMLCNTALVLVWKMSSAERTDLFEMYT